MVNGSIRVTVGDSYDNCIYPGNHTTIQDKNLSLIILQYLVQMILEYFALERHAGTNVTIEDFV